MSKKPKECPDIKMCKFRVTKDFYTKICTGNFGACRIYADRKKQLKYPFEWVQHIAVEQSDVVIHA